MPTTDTCGLLAKLHVIVFSSDKRRRELFSLPSLPPPLILRRVAWWHVANRLLRLLLV